MTSDAPKVKESKADHKPKKASANDQPLPSSKALARVKAERQAKNTAGSAPKVGVANFKNDRLFPRIERAVAAILAKGKVVTPIDVLIRMELLKPENVENWRFGRVPYLERVIRCNLTKLGKILRILRAHAHDLKLVPSHTAYVRSGTRGHKAPLRFSKTGDPKVEEAYSRHFVWPGKAPFHMPSAKSSASSSGAHQPPETIRGSLVQQTDPGGSQIVSCG